MASVIGEPVIYPRNHLPFAANFLRMMFETPLEPYEPDPIVVRAFDTFLMSCRVIGRTVETAMLATVTEDALAAGAKRLAGWFLPTKKNAPAQAIYEHHGFKKTEESSDGTRWELDLGTDPVEAPGWIQRNRT